MQPYFFPYIGYWQLINAVDQYVIFDDVNYISRGWINRNRILINGKPEYITMPLEHASIHKLIKESTIVDDQNIAECLLKTLNRAYANAPFYEMTIKIIEEILHNNDRNLSTYLEFSIRKICAHIGIKTNIILSSTIEKSDIAKGENKILEICDELGATNYINAIGGRDLYSVDNYKTHGIELKFLKSSGIKYKQFNDVFIPNLSIIDVMMFNSIYDIKSMLNNYELV